MFNTLECLIKFCPSLYNSELISDQYDKDTRPAHPGPHRQMT